jgi:hypothetical protein
MDTKKNKTIRILTQTIEVDTKSALPAIGRRITTKTLELTNDVLANCLEEFFSSFDSVLERLPNSVAGFSIDELELTLAINASGGIEVIGKAEAGISTGMKFTLKRQNKQP